MLGMAGVEIEDAIVVGISRGGHGTGDREMDIFRYR